MLPLLTVTGAVQEAPPRKKGSPTFAPKSPLDGEPPKEAMPGPAIVPLPTKVKVSPDPVRVAVKDPVTCWNTPEPLLSGAVKVVTNGWPATPQLTPLARFMA